ncbi:MAG: DUF6249 domain-containing protein [Pseudomonadota bacterium]
MEEFYIVAVSVLATAAMVIALLYFRAKGRKELHTTLRTALEKGESLSPEVLEGLSHSKSGDFRRGLLGLAIGVAFGLFGLVIGEEDAVRPMLGIAMFPIMVGVAYLLMWWRSTKS